MSAPLADLKTIVPSLEMLNGHSGANDGTVQAEDQEFQLPLKTKSKIPDGGWGWVVVFASLIISMIMDGISFSFGILYIEFYKEFGASSSETSMIGSLFLAVPLLTGPIMSVFVDRYGCCPMTIVGGLVSALGFVLSSYARKLWVLYVTFGVISGLGLGLTYVTAVVSIAFWFDKKRNLAVGLGACGVGIGTFVYAPFTTYLLEEYGWRGTLVLLAGSLLHMCVCGLLMRDPDWIIEQDRQNSKSSKGSSVSLISERSDNKIDLDEIKKLLKTGQNAEFILQTLATSIDNDEERDKSSNQEHHQSALNLPTFIKQNEKVPFEVLEQLSENKSDLYKIIIQNYPSLLQCRSISDKGLNKISNEMDRRIPVTFSVKVRRLEERRRNWEQQQQHSLPEKGEFEPFLAKEKAKGKLVRTNSTPWLVRRLTQNAPHQQYFKNIRFGRQSLIHKSAALNKNKYRLRASSCPNIYRVSMTTIKEEDEEGWSAVCIDLFKDMIDFSLFNERHFFLMSLSTIILFAWFMTPYFYLVDHMKAMDFTKNEASFVISFIGITNTIGMVALGWTGDQKWANVTKIYAVSLVFCGICCSAMIFCQSNYVLLVIVSGLYGIFLASSFTFTPTILVELVPLDRFTTAYGLSLLCSGIGHLGGPPLAGLFYDITNTWDLSFHLSGFFIVISGILIGFIPYTTNRKMFGGGPIERDVESK